MSPSASPEPGADGAPARFTDRFEIGDGVRALFLDIDGVLNDHRTAADAAVYDWALTLPGWSLGPQETADEWERLDRLHFSRYQRGELTYLGQRRQRIREFVPGAASATDAEADALMDGFFRFYKAARVPYADVASFIARLRGAVARRAGSAAPLAVAYVTNGDEEMQRDKLRAIGALEPAWPLVASAQAGASKPDPAIFGRALAALRAHREDALMIGDDAWSDIDGAHGAGITALHLVRPGANQAESSEPAPAVRSLDDVVLS